MSAPGDPSQQTNRTPSSRFGRPPNNNEPNNPLQNLLSDGPHIILFNILLLKSE